LHKTEKACDFENDDQLNKSDDGFVGEWVLWILFVAVASVVVNSGFCLWVLGFVRQ
jgi:hypothetical protein